MRLQTLATPQEATHFAADLLAEWLSEARAPALMVAGGNTPLPLYAEIARRSLRLDPLRLYVLDEYVGVPDDDPRTCTNLLRQTVKEPWGICDERFFGLTSVEADARARVEAHERRIEEAGGLDAIVLGLGENGHLGFNEPGSARDSGARLVTLEPVSIEANRSWFSGEHAPGVGATVGLRTILAARKVLLLAFGARKRDAVRAMLRGAGGDTCPAAWLREHPAAHVFVDLSAAGTLRAT